MKQKSRKWSLIFNTHNGMAHPLRLDFHQEVDSDEVFDYAKQYIEEHKDFLQSVDQIYPTKEE